MNDTLDDDHPLWLVNEQIKGLLEGDGASEDHEEVISFLKATGLPDGTVFRIHMALVNSENPRVKTFDQWHKEHAKYMEPADIVHWCREAWEASRAALPKPKPGPVARDWPVMGYGRVAIGGGMQPNGMQCLLYMDMGETREIDADTTDLFPVGSNADPQKTMAAIYFKDGAAMQQTIDVLREMQEEIGYVPPQPDDVRDAERYRWLRAKYLSIDYLDGQGKANLIESFEFSESECLRLDKAIDAAIAAARGEV